eukprot:SAG11_NODE_17005_length_531_cov_1.004630_1_plen_120_part_01
MGGAPPPGMGAPPLGTGAPPPWAAQPQFPQQMPGMPMMGRPPMPQYQWVPPGCPQPGMPPQFQPQCAFGSGSNSMPLGTPPPVAPRAPQEADRYWSAHASDDKEHAETTYFYNSKTKEST